MIAECLAYYRNRREDPTRAATAWTQYGYTEEIRDGLLIRRSPEFTYYNRLDRMLNWQAPSAAAMS